MKRGHSFQAGTQNWADCWILTKGSRPHISMVASHCAHRRREQQASTISSNSTDVVASGSTPGGTRLQQRRLNIRHTPPVVITVCKPWVALPRFQQALSGCSVLRQAQQRFHLADRCGGEGGWGALGGGVGIV